MLSLMVRGGETFDDRELPSDACTEATWALHPEVPARTVTCTNFYETADVEAVVDGALISCGWGDATQRPTSESELFAACSDIIRQVILR